MISKSRLVIDTNIIISQLFWPNSLPRKAFRKALSVGTLLISEETLEELMDALGRKKFESYLSAEEKQYFLHQLSFIVEIVPHVTSIKACRDPKDDKFLSLAMSGKADTLLTGDKDLLALDPFGDIRILTCSAYLQTEFVFREERALLA
jgi:putative PIN family toxin of toxin-antitoxin system